MTSKSNLETTNDLTNMKIDTIKNTVDDVEQSKNLISEKIEDQNLNIKSLIQDNKKLFLETSKIKSQIKNLLEQ